MEEDEDESFGGLYENGHWVWDEHTEALVFVRFLSGKEAVDAFKSAILNTPTLEWNKCLITGSSEWKGVLNYVVNTLKNNKSIISDLPPMKVEAIQITSKAPTGVVEFRDDIDLIEQLRFKRRYQRKPKPGHDDVVTIQDVKDIAIYTAPVSILSPMLIDMLHLPTTERFLRALIFCCAYYLQVADDMAMRMLECETKIRTKNCEVLEEEFRSNLSDLRVLVAKEYCVLLIGGGDLKKFHHMGSNKKRRSLSDKDARLFETFAHVSVQIVYLALGRKNYRQIELECHRLFKTDIFNTVEHTYKTGYIAQMTPEERKVLLGSCLLYEKKLNTRSPLMNEVFCQRPIDFRMMGLGVVKYEKITKRLNYLYLIVAGPEETLRESKITVGIIGMRRSLFDIMLHPISAPAGIGKSKSSMSASQAKSSKGSTGGSPCFKSMTAKSSQTIQRFYPEIILPPKDIIASTLPSDFPEVLETVLHVSQVQRRRWQNRLMRLTSV